MENVRTVRSIFGLAVTLFALSSHQQVLVRADDTLYPVVCEAFVFTGEQLTATKTNTLVTNDLFTSYTNEDGEWITEKSNGDPVGKTVWTSGMVAGMYWHQYEATGQSVFKDFAEDIQVGLEGVEELDDNDTGFQVLNAFGLGYRLAGTDSDKERVLTGADTLHGNRFVSNIPAFWSWDNPTRRPEWNRAVNVDMIMNMEIMLWAAVNGGDPGFSEDVAGHADTTWEYIVRDDFSTFHVADFDIDSGDLVDQGTYQGWQDDSTWSRGQAWAVYGFTMVYRFLGDDKYLERAINVLSYFDDNLPEDNVPYADFDAPIDSNNPRDSSATAIVASALLELFQLTGNPSYLEMAQEYMSSLLLSPEYFDPTATDGWEALLRKSAADWGGPEVGSITGDYYTLEMMVRYKIMAPSILLRDEAEATTTNDQLVFSGGALDNDVDVSGLAEDAPVIVWFGVTLDGTENVPNSLSIGSVPVDVPAPAGGWIAGMNIVSFSVSSGTFVGLDTVDSVTVDFTGPTTATIHYLIVGHRFNTMLDTTATTTDDDSEMTVTATDDDSKTNDDICASNGVDGIYGDRGVCCPTGCGQCGGARCASFGRENGMTAMDCCQGYILESDRLCNVTEQAPCILA